MVANGQETVFWKTPDDDGRHEDCSLPATSRQNQITGDSSFFSSFHPIRSQFQNKANAQYSGTYDAIKKIARREGLNGESLLTPERILLI